jgi:DNA polymerase-3 subunit gamma/tau
MSYLVLARKYRPQTFDTVVAQEHVTRTLRNAVKNNKIGSGYLFCGPRGTGKTTVARLLAKAINCKQGPTDTPCGVCDACREIAAGTSMDVLEIDAASNTGVDDIRQLRENVRYMPSSGEKRIYIVDEVHRLSGSAFDALLKTLEEPPAHVVFMFATTEPLKVPDTILSRTQRFDFRRVSIADLAGHLKNICDQEKIAAEEAALLLIARKGDGSVRDSLSLLDQVAAYAGEKITEQDVVNALGLVDRQFLFSYTTAIAESDRRKVLQLTRQMFDAGIDIKDFVTEILEHFRLLMILEADPESIDTLGLSEAELTGYRDQARNFTTGDLMRMIKILTDLNVDLKGGLDERLLIEIAGVKMAEMESTVRFEEILAKLQNLSAAGSGALPAANSEDLFGPAQKKNSEPALAAMPQSAAPSRELKIIRKTGNLAQVKAGWPDFLNRLRSKNPMIASQLGMATISGFRDNTVELAFSGSTQSSMAVVQKPENLQLITRTLTDHFGDTMAVSLELDKKTTPEPVDGEQNGLRKVNSKELIEKSPRLQRLIEKVDGEVIGVRPVQE